MAEVASAFVTLIPSFKGGQAEIAKQFDGPSAAAGKSSGGKFGGALSGVLKKSALGIGVAAGGILGTALFKGFERLSAIDDAKAKLLGLGNSAKTVSTVMDNALASVKGTAFGLGDAATVAAGAIASGIKPGQELTANLKLVADAATIGGTSLSEMGAIFNKVAASGKVQGDVIAQLGDKGIPILQLLGKEIGKTPAETAKLASAGKIDFKTFSAALQAGVGGAALKSGNTFKGALANMNAALGRLGAGLLTGLFPIAKQVFGKVTVFLDQLTKKVTPFANAFAAKLPGAFKAVGAAISGLTSGAGGKLKPLVDAFKGFVTDVIDAGKKAGPALLSIAQGIAPLAKAAVAAGVVALTAAFTALGPAVSGAASAFAGTVDTIANNQTTFAVIAGIITTLLIPALTVLATQATIAAAATTSAFLASKVAAISSLPPQILSLTLIAAGWVTTAAAATAGAIAVAAAWLISVAPVLIAIAVIALAVVLVVKYWGQIKAFILAAVSAVVSFVSSHWKLLLALITGPIGAAVIFVISHWNQIKAATSAAFNSVKSAVSGAMGAVASAVTTGIGKVVGFFKGLPKKLLGVLKGAGTILTGVGRSIVSGLLNGLKEAWHKVTDYLKNKISALSGAAKKLLHINSPSKVFAEIGSSIGEGMALGINKSSSLAVDELSKSTGSLVSSVTIPTGSQFKASTAAGAPLAGGPFGGVTGDDHRLAKAVARAFDGMEFQLTQDNRRLKTRVRNA